ncbi:hypothetical protein DFH09DRAFT_1167128 [Mycena vulgaris]|nr:hypothetical protein DFH09DRAFT_1167128 [Mycena vulgaris]
MPSFRLREAKRVGAVAVSDGTFPDFSGVHLSPYFIQILTDWLHPKGIHDWANAPSPPMPSFRLREAKRVGAVAVSDGTFSGFSVSFPAPPLHATPRFLAMSTRAPRVHPPSWVSLSLFRVLFPPIPSFASIRLPRTFSSASRATGARCPSPPPPRSSSSSSLFYLFCRHGDQLLRLPF